MVAVSSWGRLSAAQHQVRVLGRDDAPGQIAAPLPGLAYGMGRSYGDVCLNPDGTLWQTAALDRLLAFDAATGRLRCEPGVLLRDIQRLMIPRGWALPVTPGTQIVTVGGAIANDVHGKNHHARGSFGDHVLSLTLLRTDGRRIVCGPQQDSDWFTATVGGMGLTGLVLEAELQLQKVPGPWLATETIPYADPGEFFRLADASEADWEYTVSWIDCLSRKGRGIFMRANPVAADLPEPAPRQRRMPITPPVSAVNKLSLSLFNEAYFRSNQWRAGASHAHYQSFFYPLDNLLEWNRMYGPRGFYQYQCVVPRESGNVAIEAMLAAIRASGNGSFLAVLKTFGDRSAPGMLSFPRPGVTLALDFPNRSGTEALFEHLDAIVAEAGGRLYMAKDARMPRSLFEAGYPRFAEFLHYRDPGISSALSRRLMGT
jgi:FAD/FMN-containing dehydrogenase